MWQQVDRGRQPFLRFGLCLFGLGILLMGLPAKRLPAARVIMKDGRVLHGAIAPIASVEENPAVTAREGGGGVKMILVIDDQLRRIFVSEHQVLDIVPDDAGESPETFRIPQKVAKGGLELFSFGAFVSKGPFDEYGRRIVTIQGPEGPLQIIQGITEITPEWTRLQGANYVWDMRVATSSIPTDVIQKLLMNHLDENDLDDRKRLVRFYIQSSRYSEASEQVVAILEDFKDQEDLQEQLAPTLRAIRQLRARQLLEELEHRAEAGQHGLVQNLLERFPTEDVAGEILQAVRQMSGEYDQMEQNHQRCIEELERLADELPEEEQRRQVAPVIEEIKEELDFNNQERMSAFLQMLGDASLPPEEKLALGISGWLVGSNTVTNRLPVAVSLYEVRDIVRRYLDEQKAPARGRLLRDLEAQEAATPNFIAMLLFYMSPPVATSEDLAEKPGFYELTTSSFADLPPFQYSIQLPPEYDPDRKYPTIVSLHGASTTPRMQIDWWAGAYDAQGIRQGQATRHGYIVIAPHWAEVGQAEYHFSAREHGCILYTLRDAMRRFSINTDRVFLTGHSMGGDAAWDIALAHPDLWAGVIPIVALSSKYCDHYWQNAELLPMYFLCGELDDDRFKMNAMNYDRYLKRRFNTTVVQFQGRGHEGFSDEIHRLFEWMSLMRRDFFPREFTVSAMRPWDYFFWWIEVGDFYPKTVLDPIDWPPRGKARAAEVEGRILDNNNIFVKSRMGKTTVWLTPDMIDFDQKTKIILNGDEIQPKSGFVEADLETMLEDARTRCDRQHPFWLKISSP